MSTHIFLVEPDVHGAKSFTEGITLLMDARVTVAQHYGDAVTLFEAGVRPDVAIIAWGVEEVRGVELIGALRHHIPELPIMLMLEEGASLPPEAEALTVQGVLTKPFRFPEIPGFLMEVITESQTSQDEPLSGLLDQLLSDEATPADTFSVADMLDEPLAGPLLRHIELSQQQAVQLSGKLEEIGQAVEEVALLLSQDGALISQVGDISPDAATAMARLTGRIWREGATRPAREWLRFDDRLPSEGGGRRKVALYSVHVAGDVTLSAAWDGGTSLSSLRVNVRKAAHVLGNLLQ